jgi:hypothetical protein
MLEEQGHIIKVKAHMTLLEDEQKQYEDLPNALEEMEVEEGKRLEKSVDSISSRILCSI